MDITDINIVFELHSTRAVEFNFLQRLAYDIIRLTFRLLGGFDHSGFVQVALFINVQFPESILEGEYLPLIKLRVLPVWARTVRTCI